MLFFFSFKMKEELHNHMEKTWKSESITRSTRVKAQMPGVGPSLLFALLFLLFSHVHNFPCLYVGFSYDL